MVVGQKGNCSKGSLVKKVFGFKNVLMLILNSIKVLIFHINMQGWNEHQNIDQNVDQNVDQNRTTSSQHHLFYVACV